MTPPYLSEGDQFVIGPIFSPFQTISGRKISFGQTFFLPLPPPTIMGARLAGVTRDARVTMASKEGERGGEEEGGGGGGGEGKDVTIAGQTNKQTNKER